MYRDGNAIVTGTAYNKNNSRTTPLSCGQGDVGVGLGTLGDHELRCPLLPGWCQNLLL